GMESEWTTYADSQQGIKEEVANWARRVNMADASNMMAVGLWGDGAPYNARDPIVLWTLTVISGR
ncbi:unnamed protein product, partial [Prorocentrum cordatum]